MPVWLINFLPVAWRWFKHLIIYLGIIALLVGPPYIGYQYGWRKGYSQCAKDRPTYGSVGTVNNNAGVSFRYLGAYFKVLFLDVKFGK